RKSWFLGFRGLRTFVCADTGDHTRPPVVSIVPRRRAFLPQRHTTHLREIESPRRFVLPVRDFVNPPARPMHTIAVVALPRVAPVDHEHIPIRPRAEIDPA